MMDVGSMGLWLCGFVSGYCFGCIDMAWILGFLKGVDIKQYGSRNAGASNAARVLGIVPGAVTAVWDIGKAVLAYLFLCHAFHAPREICLFAAGMAVIGHCFPFWLDFDGGKGFAPYLGLMLCIDPGLAALPLMIGAVLCVAFDRFVLLTFTCAALMPVGACLALGDLWLGAFCTLLSLVLFCRHRQNIRNMMSGTEPGILALIQDGESDRTQKGDDACDSK